MISYHHKALNICINIMKNSVTTATLTDFLAYKNDDVNAQRAWELLNPTDKPMNHQPTDVAIKSSVILALGSSVFGPYCILAQRYRQNDNANKTWTDLRMDIESNITNNVTGTSRDPDIHMRRRDRTFRECRRSPSRFDKPSTESRSSRTLYDTWPQTPQRTTSQTTPPSPRRPCRNSDQSSQHPHSTIPLRQLL